MPTPPKTLVVLPNWLGDAVIATALLEQLHQQGARIDVLAHAPVADLAAFMPHVEQVLVPPFARKSLALAARWRYARQHLREYERAIVLPNSFKSALLPFFAGIPIRVGYVGEQRYGLLNVWHRDSAMPTLENSHPALPRRTMAAFYGALAYPPAPQPPHRLPLPALLAPAASELGATHYGVFCPGAEFGPAKRWPSRYWAQLAQRLVQAGAVRSIVLVGSGKDRAIGAEIVAALPDTLRAQVLNRCGETTIAEALALLAQSLWVVANDSGLMHCAAALNKPVLGLYGPTDFWHTPPRGKEAHTMSQPVDCAPCQLRQCPLLGEAHQRCMTGLTPAVVLAHPMFAQSH